MLAKGGIYFSVYLEKSNSNWLGCKFLKSCEIADIATIADIADIADNCGQLRILKIIADIADNCGQLQNFPQCCNILIAVPIFSCNQLQNLEHKILI
jgi:hypothetical protein